MIGEEIVKPYDKTLEEEQVYGINVYYADGYAFVAKVYGEYKEYYNQVHQYNEATGEYEWVWVGKYIEDPYNCDVTVYDPYGNKVMDFEPNFSVSSSNSYNYYFDDVFSFFTLGEKDCAYYENKLFEINENGETKLLKIFEDSSFDIVHLMNNGTFIERENFYIYKANGSPNVYTYFDKEFNYVKTFTYFYTTNVQLGESIILANGNIFFMKSEFLGNNDKDYDVKTVHPYTGEPVYTRCIYELYNATTGELSEVEIPEGMIIDYIELTEETDFDADKAVALVTANKVIDGNVYNEPRYFFMDNDANFVAEIKIPHDVVDYYRVSDNNVVVELPYVSFLYKNDGTQVGKIDTLYNNKLASYFVYENKILDMNLNTVYTIPEDYSIEKIYNDFDTIIFSTTEENEDGEEIEVYYQWKGTAIKLDCDDFDYESNLYILDFEETIEDENGERTKYTSKFYTPDGAELFTITSEDGAVYEYKNIGNAYVLIVETEDEETGDVTTTYKVYYAD